jgi:hypothetical protein
MCNCKYGQLNNKESDFHEKCRQLVLNENRINQNYYFKKNGQDIDELSITYIGVIYKENGEVYKIMNSIYYFGLYEDSKRVNSAIMIYNKLNEFIGMYNVDESNLIATRIENNNLIFDYKNQKCNQKTIIFLKDSIPNKIFINCTEKGGDIYYLTR